MNIDLVLVGKRIATVKGKMNGKEFGKLIGVSNKSVSCYESGAVWPKPQTLAKIIELSGKPADWLLFGVEPDAGSVTEPPAQYTVEMPVRAMAGAGDPCCLEQLEPIGHIHVPIEYNGPNITVLQIRGTSMEPHIKDGAHVGIDRTDRHVVSGELYAIYIPHEGIVVKRLYLGPELVTITSDNPSFPDQVMSNERINWDTFVLGRVKWGFLTY